jgi:hypothetical protein
MAGKTTISRIKYQAKAAISDYRLQIGDGRKGS